MPRVAEHDSTALLVAVDLAGTFVFAVEGGTAAIAARLDLLGVLVLAFATALAGGVVRDVLIGAVPPRALDDWRYPAAAFAGGALVFLLHRAVLTVPGPAIVGLDAAGLALFAVAGTEKALAFGINPFVSTLLGTITAVGGGTVRDLLLAQVPVVLRADVYATAALVGAVVLVVARRLGVPPAPAAVLSGFACFGLRVVSVWQHWSLPHALGT
jgi:uncharacterized membrane protein YeiH